MEYKIDTVKLSTPPEIRLWDKIYKIDNRLSVIHAIDKGLKKDPSKEFEIIIEAALGKDAYDEIMARNPELPIIKELVIAIRAGMAGITMEESREQFRKNG